MLRIIQWATGPVGREAAAAVHAHPEMQLLGGLVYDAENAGRDLGESCGLGQRRRNATSSVDEVLTLEAGCVLYCAQGEGRPDGAVEDICRVLASGKNVVSTALTALIYPKAAGPKVVEQLEAACKQGGVSFHATGIEPGWAG